MIPQRKRKHKLAHEQAVNSVAFDPTGDRLVSGSNDLIDNNLKIWDANTY